MMLTYEFPLNEKSRTYLRFDTLFQQLAASRALDQPWQVLSFFKSLFDFCELSERCDIRTDLMKDLEKQRIKLQSWRQLPEADLEKIDQLQNELATLAQELPRSVRAGSRFKEDRILGAIRQRFAIPGGLCAFDVPLLHHWLGQPEAQRHQDIENWMQDLDLLIRASGRLLQLWRDSGEFEEYEARNGFYQGSADGCELIRLQVDASLHHYPTISGHKTRFAIRFVPFGEQETGNIPFKLARC